MKRGGPRRSWVAARNKVESEGHRCRYCRSSQQVQAAHVVGREHDRTPAHRWILAGNDPFGWAEPYPVHPDRIVPLCAHHHLEHDSHRLELQPHLTLSEQIQAVADCDGIENARVRVSPTAYPKVAA